MGEMALVTTGTVVQYTKDCCSVSVCIHGENKPFKVTKSQFYVFNLKCEDFRNLIDEGMQVEVCYKLFPGSFPRVLSAWLGERPDGFDSEDREPLPVYDLQGVYQSVCSDGFVIGSDCGTVFVEQVNFFRDGLRASTFANAQEVIWFDAVPVGEEHVSGALYVATCAWVGSKPTVVERIKPHHKKQLFTDEVEFDFSIEGNSSVTGTVGVIPNESVAIADAILDGRYIKVLIFRRSFTKFCDRIDDIVKVGGSLCMSINYTYLLQGRRYWFAEKASNTRDTCTVDDSKLADELIEVVSNEDGPVVEAETISVEPVELDCPGTSKEAGESEVDFGLVTPNFNEKFEVLVGRRIRGVLEKYFTNGCIFYEEKKIFLDWSNFFVDRNEVIDPNVLLSTLTIVNFQAISSNRHYGYTYEATLAWIGKKPRLLSILSYLPPPKLELLEEKDQFYGIVRKLLLPRFAFVLIPGLSTMVVANRESFVGFNKNACSSITDFVGFNYCVQFQICKETPGYLGALNVQIVRCKDVYGKVCSGKLSRVPALNVSTTELRKGQRDSPIQT